MYKITVIIVFILNSTWGVIQSGIGFILFLLFLNKPHYWYKGSIVTIDAVKKDIPLSGGVSLGIFIFITSNIKKEQASESRLVNHEYGHSLQSILLGPLYLLIVGIPSMVWNMFFKNYRRKHNIDYYSFFVERWADKWGKIKTIRPVR